MSLLYIYNTFAYIYIACEHIYIYINVTHGHLYKETFTSSVYLLNFPLVWFLINICSSQGIEICTVNPTTASSCFRQHTVSTTKRTAITQTAEMFSLWEMVAPDTRTNELRSTIGNWIAFCYIHCLKFCFRELNPMLLTLAITWSIVSFASD